MKIKFYPTMISLLIGVFIIVNGSFATNGYFSHGYGIRYKGMAGVGVSLFRSSLSSATNPASMVFVGKRYDINLALFNPNREFTVTGNPSGFAGTFPLNPGTTESDNSIFLIPSLGGNWMIGENNSIGVAIYGNGGMNSEYPAPVFGGTVPTGVNLIQLFVNASYARKLGENHSLGVSAIIAAQSFEATGLENFAPFSSNPAALSDNDTDVGTGFGFKVGYQGELTEDLRLGVSYQSKIQMSEFDDYAGLFAEQGGFDIPATWTAGLSYNIGGNFIAAVDVQQIMYSDVNSIANPIDPMALPPGFPDGSPNPNHVPLGDDNGSGFGWRDMTVLKVGGEFLGLDSWKIRGGVSFALDDQPIPKSEMIFNILAPGVINNHASLGFSKLLGAKNEISLALTRAFSNSVSGPNVFEAPGQQTIELKMDQWEIEIGFSF